MTKIRLGLSLSVSLSLCGVTKDSGCARKPEANSRLCSRARAITGRNRSAIYYAPLDHHLNANSLITPGANCYALARLLARSLARSPMSANFRSVFRLATAALTIRKACFAIPAREKERTNSGRIANEEKINLDILFVIPEVDICEM